MPIRVWPAATKRCSSGAGQYLGQAQLLCVMQRTAESGGETVAVDPQQVDIAGTFGDALIEQLDAFVDQHEQAAIMDFLIIDGAARHLQFIGQALGEDDHFIVLVALAAFIAIEATAGFLAEAAERVEFVPY